MTATSAAKEKILSSIRQNLAASRAFESHHAHAAAVSVSTPSPDATDPVERFGSELEALGVTCYLADDRSQARDAVTEILREANITTIAVSDSSLAELLFDSGVEVAVDAPKDYLFGADAGMTGARWAIAETGTLVLCSASERNRLASLVPPIHICVVNARDIRHTMGEILQMIDTRTDAAVTFITGASRTSDIELTLAIGVHGPKRLIVIVIAK
jgi:L-lactate dehydrogenase complex protein LldG